MWPCAQASALVSFSKTGDRFEITDLELHLAFQIRVAVESLKVYINISGSAGFSYPCEEGTVAYLRANMTADLAGKLTIDGMYIKVGTGRTTTTRDHHGC